MTTTNGVVPAAPMAGLLVRLPVGRLVDAVLEHRPDFVAVDMVSSPLDEIEFHRVVMAAHAAGVRVVAIVDETAAVARPAALGADTVIRPGSSDLIVVADAAAAIAAMTGGSAMVALDVEAAVSGSIVAFMAARQVSEAPTLVLLPGMLGDARLFEDVVALLPGPIVCQPLRIDLDDSIDEMAASALAAAPNRFALAGHSLGGIVGLAMWRREPDRITRLALLNTSARAPSVAQLDAWHRLRERTDSGQFEAIVAEQALLNLGPAAHDATLVTRWTEMALKVGADGFQRQLDAQAGRTDSASILRTISVGCLVVSGSDDKVCPPPVQAELAAHVTGAQHVTIPGAGHMTPIDRPVDVAAALAAWLADV